MSKPLGHSSARNGGACRYGHTPHRSGQATEGANFHCPLPSGRWSPPRRHGQCKNDGDRNDTFGCAAHTFTIYSSRSTDPEALHRNPGRGTCHNPPSASYVQPRGCGMANSMIGTVNANLGRISHSYQDILAKASCTHTHTHTHTHVENIRSTHPSPFGDCIARAVWVVGGCLRHGESGRGRLCVASPRGAASHGGRLRSAGNGGLPRREGGSHRLGLCDSCNRGITHAGGARKTRQDWLEPEITRKAVLVTLLSAYLHSLPAHPRDGGWSRSLRVKEKGNTLTR